MLVSRKTTIRAWALGGCAVAGLLSATSAFAQDGGEAVSEVVVTGSRVIQNGFQAPTPVTVISATQLQATAPNSLSDAINQLPQFKSSFVPASTGFRNGAGNGGAFINLRGLGPKRTLVLLDGKRVVQSQANGSVAGATDLNVLPQMLVQRVDVVTGGASAAYGADALSGVVNFVLDKKFTGFKGEIRGGIAQAGDKETYAASFAYGRSFMDDKLHVLGSYEYYRTLGIKDFSGRDWAADSTATLTTPAAAQGPQTSINNPTRIIASNIRPSNMSSGGLITGGATALRDLYFAGPGAIPTPFPVGTLRTATTMVGGSNDPDYGRYYSSLPPQTRHNAFGRLQYDLNSDWNVYAEGMYGYSESKYRGTLSSSATTQAFTIFADNPYLPASVRAQMNGPGATSAALFNPATGQFNGPTVNTITLGRLDTDWGWKDEYSLFQMARGVLGIDGKIGGWNVNAYYTHGESAAKTRNGAYPDLVRLYNAIDAVASPGGAGLPAAGTPICRSTLTTPGNGCVPLNVIGQGVASPEALKYVFNTGGPYSRQKLKQDVAEIAVRGDLFSLWAGPISVGAGASYRKESVVGLADALSESYLPALTGTTAFKPGLTPALTINGFPTTLRGSRGGWESGNPGGFAGEYSVKEVFGEALVPLLKDLPFARSLDFNGAIRYADYSTSGGVTNWKLGLTYEPLDGVRFRTTRSRDIRAANLADLYAGVSQNNPAIIDIFRRNENNTNAVTASKGNPELQPERGDTFTAGVVFSPSFIPGFTLSVDYYHIIITNAIAAPGAVTILQQCQQGNQVFCGLITRNSDPSSFGGFGIGPITRLENSPQNIGTTKNAGVDIEASYRLPLDRLFDGRQDSLTFRLVASYMGKNSSYVLGGTSVTNSVGVVGGGIVGGTGGNTDWQGSLNINYVNGPFSLNWQTRFINGGRLNANVDDQGNPYPRDAVVNPNPTGNGQVPNRIGDWYYTDLSLSYKFGKERQFETFMTVNNLFDKDPPKIGSYFFYGVLPTNYTLYDTVGRNFTMGLRFKY
jgi:outer membrane receptor protein involved in Fe transport